MSWRGEDFGERTLELSQANDLLRQEILERKRVEEALRESEDKYKWPW